MLLYYYMLAKILVTNINYLDRIISYVNRPLNKLNNLHLNQQNEHLLLILFQITNSYFKKDSSYFIKQFYQMRMLFIDILNFIFMGEHFLLDIVEKVFNHTIHKQAVSYQCWVKKRYTHIYQVILSSQNLLHAQKLITQKLLLKYKILNK